MFIVVYIDDHNCRFANTGYNHKPRAEPIGYACGHFRACIHAYIGEPAIPGQNLVQDIGETLERL